MNSQEISQNQIFEKIQNMYYNKISTRSEEIEKAIINKDPHNCYYYALAIIKGRWLEVEPYIMQDPQSAHLYALHVIKGRWPEAEPYIMKNPYWAFEYASYVIKNRWLEAESIIMKDPENWLDYKIHFKFNNCIPMPKTEMENQKNNPKITIEDIKSQIINWFGKYDEGCPLDDPESWVMHHEGKVKDYDESTNLEISRLDGYAAIIFNGEPYHPDFQGNAIHCTNNKKIKMSEIVDSIRLEDYVIRQFHHDDSDSFSTIVISNHHDTKIIAMLFHTD